MRTRSLTPSSLDLSLVRATVPISHGGTNATTPEEAVVQLEGVSRDALGTANGPVPLDINGSIDVQYFLGGGSGLATISGPKTVFPNETAIYKITNFSSFKTYTLTTAVNNGSATRVNDTITYSAPAGSGQAGFTLNGVKINIDIVPVANTISVAVLNAPGNVINEGVSLQFKVVSSVNIIPGTKVKWRLKSNSQANNLDFGLNNGYIGTLTFGANNETSVGVLNTVADLFTEGPENFTIEILNNNQDVVLGQSALIIITDSSTTPIVVNQPTITSPINGSTNRPSSLTLTGTAFVSNGGGILHVSSDWEIATNNTFLNVVQSFPNDTVNKTSKTFIGLVESTVYYARVRYRGTGNILSNWSSTITFTTKTNFVFDSIQTLTKSSVLTPAPLLPNMSGFGDTIQLSSDGLTLCVGRSSNIGFVANPAPSPYSGVLGIIYKRLTLSEPFVNTEKILTSDADLTDFNELLLHDIKMTKDAQRVFISPSALGEQLPTTDFKKIFLRYKNIGGQTFSQIKEMILSSNVFNTAPNGHKFRFRSLDTTRNGNTIVVNYSFSDEFYSNSTNHTEIISNVTNDGTDATVRHLYTETGYGPQTYDLFSSSVISRDAERVATSLPTYNNATHEHVGKIVIRKYDSGTSNWIVEQELHPDNPTTNQLMFGAFTAISPNGEYIATLAGHATGHIPDLYIFKRTGSVWAKVYKVSLNYLTPTGPNPTPNAIIYEGLRTHNNMQFNIDNDRFYMAIKYESSDLVRVYEFIQNVGQWSVGTFKNISALTFANYRCNLSMDDNCLALAMSSDIETEPTGTVHIFN